MKFIKIVIYSILLIQVIKAKECSQEYTYLDKHNTKTVMKNSIFNDVAKIEGNLHVRYLENNGTQYNLFWLENGIIDKDKIDIHSIYAPFLIKTTQQKNEFIIESMKILSKDKNLYQQVIGIVDLLQIKVKKGLYRLKNGMGSVDINETIKNHIYTIKRLKQYKKNIAQSDIQYLHSNIDIILDKNCSLWKRVRLEEEVEFNVHFMKSTMIDKRNFKLDKVTSTLSKNHWFFKLSTDLSKWGFKKEIITLSLNQALLNFRSKEKEMLAIVEDSKKFGEWVKKNIDFLSYLSQILESEELNDKVSQYLFAKLAFIDSFKSTKILTEVMLNQNIIEKERFRGLMGLKNTSAPISQKLVDELIEYGLSAQNGDDFIKNASGMIIGALAKERINRDPEQFERLSNAIITAIETQDNKSVSLVAAGNMLNTAPDNMVYTIDSILLSTTDSATLLQVADALERIDRSNLDTKTFQDIFEKENNSDTSSQLIRASASAKDFKSNKDFKNVLIKLSANKNKVKSNRIAALDTLKKSNFGKSIDDKKIIRKMMIGEEDSDIMKQLKVLYRK